jgi:hypothetical protein
MKLRLFGIEAKLRTSISQNICLLEALIYMVVGLLLAIAAGAAVFQAGVILWRGFTGSRLAESGLLALDQLLLVLMLVEILHTVRISIRSQELIMVPFLIVGLIASIRRVLVITTEAANLTKESHMSASSELAFRNSMIELAVLGVLILIFVGSIGMLRRSHSQSMIHSNAEAAKDE